MASFFILVMDRDRDERVWRFRERANTLEELMGLRCFNSPLLPPIPRARFISVSERPVRLRPCRGRPEDPEEGGMIHGIDEVRGTNEA
jgi:hypothetical protein